MSVLKCEKCGGSLNIIEGTSICECEYCGTKQTIPVENQEKSSTVYQNVLERATQKQAKKGVSYPEKDGKLYNVFKFFYVIAFIFGNFMNLLYILGMTIAMTDNANLIIDVGSFVTIIVCVVLMIAALIASKFNKNVIVASVFGAVNLGAALTAIFTFMHLMPDDTVAGGINISFYWRHLAPLSILGLCAVGMALIVIIAYFKTKKAYNEVLENIYYEYNKLPNEEKPDWEEYVKNYKFGKK